MLTFPLYLLLMVASLPIAVVMPQIIPLNISYSENMNQEHCYELMNSPDPTPWENLPWYCVCSKCQNNQGAKGDRGDMGLPGMPGPVGARGMKGYRGLPGPFGVEGMKGQKGDIGKEGQRGLCGEDGMKGSTGFKGDTGDPGLKGYQGDEGPTGDDGICPETCESIAGPPGGPGLTGPVGDRGLFGPTGLRGPKGNEGEQGETGPLGAPGPVGEKGQLGPKGDCNCKAGNDGLPGVKGIKGDEGPQGDEGHAGQTGVQGDEGAQGLPGIMGFPGSCKPLIPSAFSAWLKHSYPFHGQPVVFSEVLYNIQLNYNASSGVYTAPTNGTFVFKYHLTIYERPLKVRLIKNDIAVVKTTDNKEFGVTSHTVILHLEQGDKIWLEVKDLSTNGIYAHSESTSTFTGFLLYQDACRLDFPGIPPLAGGVTFK